MAKAKDSRTIRVLLIEDTVKGRGPLRSLLSGRSTKGIRVISADTIPAIRKKIAGDEIDVVVVSLQPDDERLWPVQEIFRKKPAFPVLVAADVKTPQARYPFPVHGTLVRADLDSFLLAQAIRTAAAGGDAGYEYGQRIREFQSSGVRFLNVILSNADGIAVVDGRGVILFINPAAREMLGGDIDVRRSRFPFEIPRAEFSEVTTRQGRGERKVLELRSVDTTWEGEKARLVSLRDISSRKTAEAGLRESEERYALAVKGSKDGLWDWDLKTDRVFYHPQWKAMLGYREDEIGASPDEWFSRIDESEVKRVRNAVKAHLRGETAHFRIEHRMRHKNGSFRWMLVRGTAVRNKKGAAVRIAGSITDFTERKRAERQLKKALGDLRFALASEKVLMEELDRKNKELVELSITDGLTGLYNHRFLQERFDFEYKRLRRYGGLLSIILIDIDLFKSVNDTYGHQFGDFVLHELGKLLKSNSREVDICGRYGGEEFMIITNLGCEDVMKYASKLHTAVENHVFAYSNHSVHVTVSMGIADYHDDLKNRQELIERADAAMYQAKKDGRNLIRLWKEVGAQDERTVDKSGIEDYKKKFMNISDQMRAAYMESIDALIKTVDAKDPMAHEHSHTVARIAVEMAKCLNLSPNEIEVIRRAGLLHDIGKIGIKQEILTKKEHLTAKEFEVLRKHPIVGCNILKDIKFLEKELPIILHHHERFDGSGYPYGLKEREIPLGARILGVADAFDAMTAGRTYKKRLERAEAIAEIREKSGTQFSPEIVEAFLKLAEMKKV